MTIEEAAQALVWWLSGQPITFLTAVSGAELGNCRYRLGIQQLQPTEKRRIFEVRPMDVPDCYEVLEVSIG